MVPESEMCNLSLTLSPANPPLGQGMVRRDVSAVASGTCLHRCRPDLFAGELVSAS